MSGSVRLDERGNHIFNNLSTRGELVIGSLTARGRFVLPAPTPPIILPPPPAVSGGWVFPRLRQHPRQRRKPRYAADTGLVELRLHAAAYERRLPLFNTT